MSVPLPVFLINRYLRYRFLGLAHEKISIGHPGVFVVCIFIYVLRILPAPETPAAIPILAPSVLASPAFTKIPDRVGVYSFTK